MLIVTNHACEVPDDSQTIVVGGTNIPAAFNQTIDGVNSGAKIYGSHDVIGFIHPKETLRDNGVLPRIQQVFDKYPEVYAVYADNKISGKLNCWPTIQSKSIAPHMIDTSIFVRQITSISLPKFNEEAVETFTDEYLRQINEMKKIIFHIPEYLFIYEY